jgi:hypothetical protein
MVTEYECLQVWIELHKFFMNIEMKMPLDKILDSRENEIEVECDVAAWYGY